MGHVVSQLHHCSMKAAIGNTLTTNMAVFQKTFIYTTGSQKDLTYEPQFVKP